MESSRHTRWLDYPLVVVATVLFCAGVQATNAQRGENVYISNLHHINDDLYAFGQNVTVDGIIDGDLIAGAYEVYVNGEVKGSENVFSYSLHHTGVVGNSLRAFVNTVAIDGRVGRSLMLFAYDSRLGKGAVVEGDAHIMGYSVRVDGVVKGNVTVRADRIFISGDIGGDVDLKGKEITLSPPVVIRGNLTYTCQKEVAIDSAAGVTVLGQTRWEQPKERIEKEKSEQKEATGTGFKTVTLELSKILAAFLFGIIVVALFRRYAEASFYQLRTRFSVSIAAGFLFLIILVIAALILVISLFFIVVGLLLISGKLAPLGALMLVLSMLMVPITAFTTVSGGIIFYSGKIIFAFLVGYLLERTFKREAVKLGKVQLLLGLILMGALFAVPYVGILIYLLASITGAGAIVLGIKNFRPEANRPQGDDSLAVGPS